MSRVPGTRIDGSSFDLETIEAVWIKGASTLGLETIRKDRYGASMERYAYGKTVPWGWEIDHIIPLSKGGTDSLSNLQPLQWVNNRLKGDSLPNWDSKNSA